MIGFKKQKVLWLFLAVAVVASALVFRFAGSPGTENKSDNAELLASVEVSAEKSETDPNEAQPSSFETEAEEKTSQTSFADVDDKTTPKPAEEVIVEVSDTANATVVLPIDVVAEKDSSVLPLDENEDNAMTVNAHPAPVTADETPPHSSEEMTCTLSVRCDTLLSNLSLLDAEKIELVPSDGVLYPAQSVAFSEGETVFDVLLREMRRCQIHMEYSVTPLYNSVYIEGIANLYEIDAGDLSGWMYRVNGVFPNFGCSLYEVKPDDRIEWVYTCDLGADVGGAYASQGR